MKCRRSSYWTISRCSQYSKRVYELPSARYKENIDPLSQDKTAKLNIVWTFRTKKQQPEIKRFKQPFCRESLIMTMDIQIKYLINTYFRAYIQLRCKYAVLGAYLSGLFKQWFSRLCYLLMREKTV